jgi:hypothetical protein
MDTTVAKLAQAKYVVRIVIRRISLAASFLRDSIFPGNNSGDRWFLLNTTTPHHDDFWHCS